MEHISRTAASILPDRHLSLPYYLLVTTLRAFARVFEAPLDIMVYVGDIWDNVSSERANLIHIMLN
jgi:hypothetical protein